MLQANRSEKAAGAVVGLHYHLHQADYWYVLRGTARVVLHDLRVGSPTEKTTFVVDLAGDEERGLFIPPGVAHGFASLTDVLLWYLVDGYYNPADELGLAWDDPDGRRGLGARRPRALARATRHNPSRDDDPRRACAPTLRPADLGAGRARGRVEWAGAGRRRARPCACLVVVVAAPGRSLRRRRDEIRSIHHYHDRLDTLHVEPHDRGGSVRVVDGAPAPREHPSPTARGSTRRRRASRRGTPRAAARGARPPRPRPGRSSGCSHTRASTPAPSLIVAIVVAVLVAIALAGYVIQRGAGTPTTTTPAHAAPRPRGPLGAAPARSARPASWARRHRATSRRHARSARARPSSVSRSARTSR